jgi:glucans biosynthesis protein
MRKPNPKDDFLEFYALLDSESVTGGYEFVVRYGAITTMDVKATIFIRKKPEVLIIAPLTSMFYFGGDTVNKPTLKPDYQPTGKAEFSMNKTDFHRREFRPQVHDSDGLLLDTVSGEKLWTPLNNAKSVSVRRFSNVLSYSLLQRDRNLNDYLDREAEYHLRPSVTVIPKSDFGPGFVRLVELPSEDEYSDNIVAGWEPQNPPEQGTSFEFAYQMKWRGDEPDTNQFRVLSTTVRPSPGSNETRFAIEFGKPDNGETIPVAELRPYILVGQGAQVKDVQFTPTDRGWLVSFTIFDPNSSQPMDISCVILRRDTFCSEKWQYLLNI